MKRHNQLKGNKQKSVTTKSTLFKDGCFGTLHVAQIYCELLIKKTRKSDEVKDLIHGHSETSMNCSHIQLKLPYALPLDGKLAEVALRVLLDGPENNNARRAQKSAPQNAMCAG
eukprot:1158797-Pelagomonas_calceolata.AAC.10